MHSADVTAEFVLPDEAATQRLGALLAPLLEPGLVFYLDGDLGAGKTTLVRAMLRSLGYEGPVKSPTYSLVEFYVISSLYLYHFDFYRFESPEEFFDAGLGEYFDGNAVCLVEWPEKAQGCAPPGDVQFRFVFSGDGRRLEGMATSEAGARCLNALSRTWQEEGSCTSPAPR
ncbi:MAG: tRNA (adenosine(37)-N6)-threonylcarbamoyltransferase complex ATPase subunit type 1 TsaE [Betaproteobacteria bacterium]